MDGDNVGLHEMAHALAYVNFNVDDGRDDGFHNRFIRFSETGRVVFENMQSDTSGGFLGRYAASRYEEFWAVCVREFFWASYLFQNTIAWVICSYVFGAESGYIDP